MTMQHSSCIQSTSVCRLRIQCDFLPSQGTPEEKLERKLGLLDLSSDLYKLRYVTLCLRLVNYTIETFYLVVYCSLAISISKVNKPRKAGNFNNNIYNTFLIQKRKSTMYQKRKLYNERISKKSTFLKIMTIKYNFLFKLKFVIKFFSESRMIYFLLFLWIHELF